MIQLFYYVVESIKPYIHAIRACTCNAYCTITCQTHKNESLQRIWALIDANESSCPDQCHLHTASLSIYEFLRTTLLRQSMLAWMSCCKNKQVY